MTLDELMQRLEDWDILDLIELFELDSPTLVNRMEEHIQENYEAIIAEVGEIETFRNYD